jgi:hypothetical protein
MALLRQQNVVADDLARHLVDLSLKGLGAQRATELALDHGEGGLHVGALVVVGQESATALAKVVKHLLPRWGGTEHLLKAACCPLPRFPLKPNHCPWLAWHGRDDGTGGCLAPSWNEGSR